MQAVTCFLRGKIEQQGVDHLQNQPLGYYPASVLIMVGYCPTFAKIEHYETASFPLHRRIRQQLPNRPIQGS